MNSNCKCISTNHFKVYDIQDATDMTRKKINKRLDAVESDISKPDKDNSLSEEMIDQMIKETERAEKAIDDTLVFVEASNRRIAAMEAHADSLRKRILKH